MKAEVNYSCGRAYLQVCGVVLAMQGDRCRDGDLPEEVYEPIPERELECATINGESIRDMPPKLVRFFRGDTWSVKMLEWVASKINETP